MLCPVLLEIIIHKIDQEELIIITTSDFFLQNMDNSSSSSSSPEEESEVLRLERSLRELKDNKIANETRFRERISGERKKSKFLIAELIAARAKLAHNNKKQKDIVALSRHKKHEVVVPPPQGVQPVGKAPEDIFPLEVWCIIFEKLKKTQDLTNCCNANRVWRKELKPKRTQFLFEQVLPILINNNLFPANQLFQRLLELRHVCRSWRRGVDSFLENHPCHYHLDEGCTRPNTIYPPDYTRGFDCYRTTYNYNFPSPDFVQHGDYKYNQRLPRRSAGQGLFCHGRSLTVHDFNATRAGELPAFWNGVRELLSQVGEHIWYLEINGDTAMEDELRAVLKLVPNLKVLSATFFSNDPPLTSPQPLPPLPKLEVLKLPSLRENPPFIHQLLSTYTHIKKLGMVNLMTVPNASLEENARNQLLDEITRPNLEAYCAPPTVCDREVAQLRRFLSCYPTLTSVSLQVPHFDSSGFQELLTELGMRTQVKTLNLKLAVKRFGGNAQFQNMLVLPDLQNLIINAGNSFGLVSIDCVLPLKSLRKLTVVGVDLGGVMRMRSNNQGGTISVGRSSHPLSPRRAPKPKPTDEKLGNVINFLGCERRLYESNVWKLMPQLEQVLLNDRFTNGEGEKPCYYYERSGYDNYWEKKANQNLN